MNTAVARENWAGQVVDGKFPLLQWLGGSERSAVFRTQLPGQQLQTAAIKLVSSDAANAARQVSHWQMAATLAHPHLIRLFHAGRCQVNNTSFLYVVMEYAEEDLSQVLPSRPLSPEEARQMLPPLIDALSYLHEKGLVHGRIKPSNIMAIADQLKLSSDSIQAVAEPGNRALPSSVFATPEATTGATSPAADVWSIGVTLVRCLSERPDIRENSNPTEPGVVETIPEPFRHIARKCLQPDPKTRCTVADIRDWLQPVPSPPAAIPQTKERARPSLRTMAPIGAIVLLLVLFALRWATHSKQENPVVQTGQQQTATVASNQLSTPASSPNANPSIAAAQGAVAERVVPDVPLSARNTIQGKIRVSVRVRVNPSGEVTSATLASAGPSKYFASKALEASRRWKFRPPEVDGQPVSSEWVLRFQFGRTATEVVPVAAAR